MHLGKLGTFFALAAATPALAFTIKDFTPTGETPGVRQVAVRFSDPMVPFGDPTGGTVPFTNSCAGLGTGRWLAPESWVFDFKGDLPAGITCKLTATPNLKALDGSVLMGNGAFAFSTGGPAIVDSNPYRWGVPEDAAFILKLSSDYDPKSLLAHAYFYVPGIASRLGIEILTGPARDEILSHEFRYLEGPRAPVLAHTVIIRPLNHLPTATTVTLVLGEGVATAKGVPRTKPQTWDYEVRAAFKVSFDCERENAKAACIPISTMHLNFGGEVSRELAGAVRLTAKVGGKERAWKPKLGGNDPYVYRVSFEGPFPEQTTFVLTLPETFKDDAGRAPINRASFPLTVKTAGYPPLVKFAAPFGIIESLGHPALPVTIRNVEAELKARVVAGVLRPDDKPLFQRWYDRLRGRFLRVPKADAAEVLGWLDRLANANREKPLLKDDATPGRRLAEMTLTRKDGKDFEVLGLPLPGPGFYIVETESQLLGQALLDKPQPMYVPAGALVTNLAVHFKRGAANSPNSLVWVTSLDKGAPVRGALVSIWDCNKTLRFKGRTGDEGWVLVDQQLPADEQLPTCFKSDTYGKGLLVVAEAGDDFSFVHTSWDSGIEPWRFNLPYGDSQDDAALHTVFDRELFKAGETVHMKTYARLRSLDGFAALPPDRRPKVLILEHEGSQQKYERELKWEDTGVATCEWEVPADAHLGTYRAYVLAHPGENSWDNQVTTGELRVEEFRLPLAKGLIDAGGRTLVAPDRIKLDVGVQYLSGGGASGQPVTVRVRTKPKELLEFPGYDGFAFLTAPLKAGTTRRDAVPKGPVELLTTGLTLDHAGTAAVTVDKLPHESVPFEVESELEFRDPAGELQTVAHTQTIWPARIALGIRPDGWAASKQDLRANVVALNREGKPVPGVTAGVRLFKREALSHRKRLVGGFYAYDQVYRTTALGSLCTGTTGTAGELPCVGKTKASGELLMEAYAEVDGKEVTAASGIYVAGKDDWWFTQENHDRMDVVPEKKSYEPGETARLQVRMPFRHASALVTVEREGILDAYVKKLSGKLPVIDLPVKDGYAPNAYVSVLAVRGRTTRPGPGFIVDLGKPAFRLGIAGVTVGVKPYQLNVRVTTDKKVYQARQEVEATIEATPADDAAFSGDGEAAVAVVDEGLLSLKPNESWNLLAHMTGLRPDRLRTYTAGLQVIGKRHFGLKGLASGGGGGVDVTRSLFDSLVYWNSRVPLDGKGKAKVKFPLNDSLTSFRVVAIAHAGLNRFGTGQTSITSTKDIMMLPGVPPVARTGDRFRATFTLRNTTNDPKTVTAELTVPEALVDGKAIELTLKPGQAKELAWAVTVPDARKGTLEYTAEVKIAGKTVDKVTVKQKLSTVVPERSLQATLVRVEGKTTVPIQRPPGATSATLVVALSPTLGGPSPGLTAYMRDYPYNCLEQRVSKAVALADDTAWRRVMSALPAYVDETGLLKYYPPCDCGSPMLTAYVLTVASESGREIPDDVRGRLTHGLTAFLDGTGSKVYGSRGADLALVKLAALDALSRYKLTTPERVAAVAPEPELWPTMALIDWLGVLKRTANVPKAKSLIEQAESQLRSRLTYRGTELQFSTAERDNLWWIMGSVDVNAVRTLLLALETGLFGDDLPKLARGVLARQGPKGYWDLTTANALGAVALAKVQAKLDSEKVSGKTAASVGKTAGNVDWSATPKGGDVKLVWGAKSAELTLTHAGDGKPWAQVIARAAVPLKAPVSAGFQLERTVLPVRVKQPGSLHVGDVLRIRVKADVQADTGFVVVDDPMPSGAAILGTGLGQGVKDAPGAAEKVAGAWPIYRETSLSGVKAYYDVVPKGTLVMEYTIRLNNAGTFRLPPTRIEAMYSPDTFGETPNEPVTVLE